MERAAFTSLYARDAAALRRMSARIVDDREHGEDLAHDALLKALLSPDGDAQQELSRGAWLHRVAQNGALDHLRRERRFVSEAPADMSRRCEDGVQGLRWGSSDRIHEAIGQLSAMQRDVIHLRYEKELDPTEAGRQLGKSADAVRHLEQRALRELRALLSAG
jgi:RNA polymerase sigma factor (sigma-70 family)